MWVLQGNGGIDPEPNETLFLLSDDQLLPLVDVRPLRKLMDRSRTEGETVSTLRWWSVAAKRCESFKQVDGQIKNPRRKLFLLCNDDPLLETDASPSNKSMDRSRNEGETVSTLRWWSVPADQCASFKQIDGQVENVRRMCLYFAMMKCCCYQSRVV